MSRISLSCVVIQDILAGSKPSEVASEKYWRDKGLKTVTEKTETPKLIELDVVKVASGTSGSAPELREACVCITHLFNSNKEAGYTDIFSAKAGKDLSTLESFIARNEGAGMEVLAVYARTIFINLSLRWKTGKGVKEDRLTYGELKNAMREIRAIHDAVNALDAMFIPSPGEVSETVKRVVLPDGSIYTPKENSA